MPYLVILWNRESRPLADVAPLRLENEFLHLDLEDASGRMVPGPRFREIRDTMYPFGGLTLPAGHALQETGDLLRVIGTEAPGAGRLSSLFNNPALAPGAYRVRARFDLHTDTALADSDEVRPMSLVSIWQSIRVDSIGVGDKNELERLLVNAGSPTVESDGRLAPKTRKRTRERAAVTICPKLGELAGSRFFHVAYSLALCDQADGPDMALVDTLSRLPGREVEAAWILDREIARMHWTDSRKKAWVESALRTRQDTLQRIVLDTWLIKLDQRKGYSSYDP
jgi:hypothetical protein